MSDGARIGRIGVLTGGGDCPGLNAVIRAVTKTAIAEHGIEVVGIEDGFRGLILDQMRPLTFEDVSNILDRGGTILGTSNKDEPSRFVVGTNASGEPVFGDVTDRVLDHVRARGIDALVCIGGDGTMSGAARLARHGLRIVGVPKTIDNDVMHCDETFGFDTAVSTATEAIDRIRTTAASHHRVMLVEMMGRNAGWLTLYAAVAGGADVVLIPEIPFDLDEVCRVCLARGEKGRAYTLVAVSEGAKPIGGEVVVDRMVREAHDPVRLGGVSEVLAEQIGQQTHLECRATVLGHVQRGGRPSARDRMLGTRFGHEAVGLVMRGAFGRMVTYAGGAVSSVGIEEVADRQRLVPTDHPLIRASRSIGVSFGA